MAPKKRTPPLGLYSMTPSRSEPGGRSHHVCGARAREPAGAGQGGPLLAQDLLRRPGRHQQQQRQSEGDDAHIPPVIQRHL